MPNPNAAPVRLVVMQGDGIGPEICAATVEVLRALDRLLKLNLAFEQVPTGLAALAAHGTTLPAESLGKAKAADGVILGPVSHNDYPPAAQGSINPSGALRKRLDLFANIRPARSRASWECRGAAARAPRS
jgi:3-isopropylmalate dehydrogenase